MDLADAWKENVKTSALCLSQSSRATFLGKGEELPGKCDSVSEVCEEPRGPHFLTAHPLLLWVFGLISGLALVRASALPSKGILMAWIIGQWSVYFV